MKGLNLMNLFEYLHSNNNDLDDHDLAVLADWAHEKKDTTPNPDWKRAFALIREGADLLLRRRARSSIPLTATNTFSLTDPIPMRRGKARPTKSGASLESA
jgi:hypothetical protein